LFAIDFDVFCKELFLNQKTRFRSIFARLQKAYPNAKTQLHHNSPFELLVATILSAQCTDKMVNRVAPILFTEMNTPEAFVKASLSKIEKIIRPTGFYHNKAKNIKNCAQVLLKRYNGIVPHTMEELTLLPGVGRKTANVVLNAAFDLPGMVVDTHVLRISKKLGFTQHKDPVKVETDLMKIVPKKVWKDFSLWLIYLGRSICVARKPKCEKCFLLDLCLWDQRHKKS